MGGADGERVGKGSQKPLQPGGSGPRPPPLQEVALWPQGQTPALPLSSVPTTLIET